MIQTRQPKQVQPCQMWHNLSHVHCAPQAHPSRNLPLQPRHATALTLPVRPEIPHQPIANQPLSSRPWPRLKPHRFAVRQAARFKTRMPWRCSQLRRGFSSWAMATQDHWSSHCSVSCDAVTQLSRCFWSQTEAAVRAFQTAHGLGSANCGPETSGRLLELMAIPMPGSAATVVPELEPPDGQQPALNGV